MSLESLLNINGVQLQSKIVSKLYRKINANKEDLLVEHVDGDGYEFWRVTGWDFSEDVDTIEEALYILNDNYKIIGNTLEDFGYEYTDTNTSWTITTEDESTAIVRETYTDGRETFWRIYTGNGSRTEAEQLYSESETVEYIMKKLNIEQEI